MSILFETILFLLIEGRKEDALKKYPQFVNEIEFFIQNDPSKKLKYLDWQLKQFQQGNVSVEELVEIVNDFDKFQSSLSNKDIIKYDFATLQSELESVKDKQNKKKEKVEKLYKLKNKPNVDSIYESNNWTIIRVKNKEAACHYGLNTKWCISQKEEQQFEEYTEDNWAAFFILLSKKFDKSNVNYKIACKVNFRQADADNFNYMNSDPVLEIEWFNAIDKHIEDNIQQILGNEYTKILNIITSTPHYDNKIQILSLLNKDNLTQEEQIQINNIIVSITDEQQFKEILQQIQNQQKYKLLTRESYFKLNEILNKFDILEFDAPLRTLLTFPNIPNELIDSYLDINSPLYDTALQYTKNILKLKEFMTTKNIDYLTSIIYNENVTNEILNFIIKNNKNNDIRRLAKSNLK